MAGRNSPTQGSLQLCVAAPGSCKRANLKEGFLDCALRKGHTNRSGKQASMAKWKRKKYEAQQDMHEQESFSPLGVALLEQFASGMSASSLQHDVFVLLFCLFVRLQYFPACFVCFSVPFHPKPCFSSSEIWAWRWKQ